MGETEHPSASGYGYVVRRHRPIWAFASTRPDITFLVAPGGYGKSVLAAQFADSCPGEHLWVRMGGCSPSASDLPAAVARGIHSRRDGRIDCEVARAVVAESGWSLLEKSLRDSGCTPSLLLLDGLDALATTEFAFQLVRLCGRLFGIETRVVVSARSVSSWFEPRTGEISSWVVPRSALEFSPDEVSELAANVMARTMQGSDIDMLVRLSAGQPALLTLLLRHLILNDGSIGALECVPGDVMAHLERLITVSTSCEVLDVLGVAAVLGSGDVSELVALSKTSDESVSAAARTVPMLRLSGGAAALQTFTLHDLACDVYRRSAVDRWWRVDGGLFLASAKVLAARGDYQRLFQTLLDSGDIELLVTFTEQLGADLLEDARLGLLELVLDRIPPVVQAGSVRLLLLGALLQRSLGKIGEAFRRTTAAQQVAACLADRALIRDCVLVEARLRWDTGEYASVVPRLLEAYEVAVATEDFDTETLLLGYLASAHAQSGDVRRGREYALRYYTISGHPSVKPTTRLQALQGVLFVLAFVCGNTVAAVDLLRKTMGDAECPTGTRLQCDANLAALLVETGRLQPALKLVRQVRSRLGECGLNTFAGACTNTEAAVRAGLGETIEAERLGNEAVELAIQAGDGFWGEFGRIYCAVMSRASGSLDVALSDAETALVYFEELDDAVPLMACLARCEVAASLLSLGDQSKAARMARDARALAEVWTADAHLLRADMVLAEIERQRGDIDAAVKRIAAHAGYIMSESCNWHVAMYVRAFPGLLGVLSRAVGVEELPVHMLRMILPEHAHLALEQAIGVESSQGIERLSVRILGHAAAAFAQSLRATPTVRVRLFGGMQVDTPSGRVSDKDWRKRKARLLFAIIVLQRGKDLSREQLFEHLWPEMTEARAKSNFYVIWSIMRRVLMGNASGGPCPFVEHQGGVCRIVPGLVKSDVADFEDALFAMRRADRAGDSQLACAAADEVAQHYRGELLPGELYDDWLSPIRDRYRHDYGDAMLRAAQLHHEAGDTEKALHLVRAALSQDPWREDLYQAALRYQIYFGQRSGAIETYTACRSRLAEDLGLDPSVETRRLYDEILAMEDGPMTDTP